MNKVVAAESAKLQTIIYNSMWWGFAIFIVHSLGDVTVMSGDSGAIFMDIYCTAHQRSASPQAAV